MKLDYNVLWIDNEPNWQEISEKELKDFLDRKGFNLNTHRLKGDENLDLVKLEKFDLILMDLMLNRGDVGGEIIKKIRDMDHLTEVVFYSQKGENEVRKIVSKMELEGVYCSGRSNEDFFEKVEKVIDTTIKKVQDLNALRGLVIAETSNYDMILLKIIKKHYNSLDGEGVERLIKKIKEKLINSLESKKKKIGDFGNLEDVENNKSCFEMYSKWMIIKEILNEKGREGEEISEIISIFEDFHEEVIKVRNNLAHVEEYNEEGIIVLKLSRDGKEDFIFNHNKCEEIREKLIKHKQNLDIISALL